MDGVCPICGQWTWYDFPTGGGMCMDSLCGYMSLGDEEPEGDGDCLGPT